MQWKYGAALLLLTLPSLALGAGFAKQSLFLSKSSVTEGETVIIHAVVSNESTSAFKGELTVKEGETKIGMMPVNLAAEEAQTVSVSWKPSAGSHTLDAVLTTPDGTVAEKQTASFSIKEKPVASNTSATAVGSSDDVKKKIADLSPEAASIAEPIFSTVDIVRAKAAEALDSGIAWAEEKKGSKTPGEVLGESTKKGPEGILGTIWYILATIVLYILSLLRYMVDNAGIFYPALAVGFIYGLYRLYKRMRRPSYPMYE